jgi:pimeloyl-ACP methyl ester carboxylesterase
MNLNFEEVRLSLPHIELAAHLYGPADGIPVIALHGWLDNAASFARLAPLLPGLRIAAVDLPGHGHSDHRPKGSSYAIWDYAHDVLQVAEQLGWQRFALLGHSMGAIVSVIVAAAAPERVSRLALIDGLIPNTAEAEEAPQKLHEALQARLALAGKKKPVYAQIDRAIEARMRGVGAVSREAAELLAQRGLMPVPGGYTWRADSQLTLPSPMRFTRAHAMAFVRSLKCPAKLVLAEQGMMHAQPGIHAVLADLPVTVEQLPGGHHLHLDDEQGAALVAGCFKAFLNVP